MFVIREFTLCIEPFLLLDQAVDVTQHGQIFALVRHRSLLLRAAAAGCEAIVFASPHTLFDRNSGRVVISPQQKVGDWAEGVLSVGCGNNDPTEGGMFDALSILRRQTNRSTQDGLPRPQLVSPPAMPLLWVSLQYPREASTLEPRGSKVARAPSITERMGQSAD